MITRVIWRLIEEVITSRKELAEFRRLVHRKLNTLENIAMSQETELQDAKAVLDVVSTGVTEIITRLGQLPADNPAIQDEIDGIKAVGTDMAAKINAVLNPPVE